MRTIIIPTTQNIELEFPVASVGDRLVAFLIDSAIQLGYMALVYFISDWLNIELSTGSIILLMLPAMVYSLFFEVVYKGQTIGKRIRNLKVIRYDGSAPEFTGYFLRWLFRLIDIWPSMITLAPGVIGFIIMSVNKKGQRLGDIVAGTTIVKEELVVNFDDTMFRNLDDSYTLQFPQIQKLTDKDIAILKDVFDSGKKSSNYDLMERLAKRVKTVTGIETTLSDHAFLEIVLKDYNYLYGRE